jgi:LysM repeat protein
VPRPYQPPLSRRPQAVQSAESPSPPRSRWLWVAVPLLVLGPVVAVVLATEWPFNRQSGEMAAAQPTLSSAQTAPVAAQPTATVVVSNPAGPGQPGATAVVAAPTPGGAAPTPAAAASAATSVAASTAQPAAAPALAAEIAASGPFRAYRVQPGDTVRFVSEMFGVSSASVIQASGLINPDQLRVGQVLTIPIQPGYLYRVKPGETLDQIAARTGVATDLIASASRLSVAIVSAGDVILIPEQLVAKAK